LRIKPVKNILLATNFKKVSRLNRLLKLKDFFYSKSSSNVSLADLRSKWIKLMRSSYYGVSLGKGGGAHFEKFSSL
jgi:hypothetical protein